LQACTGMNSTFMGTLAGLANNPLFPALRSDPMALSGASRRKQTPCSRRKQIPCSKDLDGDFTLKRGLHRMINRTHASRRYQR
jgi:hypothetical protein